MTLRTSRRLPQRRGADDPDALAFNPGVIDHPDRISIKRTQHGKQDGDPIRMLSFLGEKWGMGSPRFSAAQVIDFMRTVLNAGGVVTQDVPAQKNGRMAVVLIEQLKALVAAVKR